MGTFWRFQPAYGASGCFKYLSSCVSGFRMSSFPPGPCNLNENVRLRNPRTRAIGGPWEEMIKYLKTATHRPQLFVRFCLFVCLFVPGRLLIHCFLIDLKMQAWRSYCNNSRDLNKTPQPRNLCSVKIKVCRMRDVISAAGLREPSEMSARISGVRAWLEGRSRLQMMELRGNRLCVCVYSQYYSEQISPEI